MNNNRVERILINATQEEEVRIALTSDQYLENIFIEEFGSHRTGNIYKGKITRIVPSLQAAFVDYGADRHGFLPLKEVSPENFHANCQGNPQNISDALQEGQELIVQVEKEERGNKGAALTSFITLAGCYLVLMPNNPRAGGISRRIEGEERENLKALLDSLNIPEDMGLIVRTAGVGKATQELQWDLDILIRLWDAIQNAGKTQSSPCLIHEESDIVIRAFRDYLRKDIDEIIIDDKDLFIRAKKHLEKVRPEIVDNVKLYHDRAIPLFSRYHIENQIETAFKRDVRLPSGGSIVIQETEALVSIDVNSSRDTKNDDIEKTAFNTNKEAAIEVARQLRLRDLGGLIVIDFIDMLSQDHQQKIVDTFKEEIKTDKARVQYNRISRFGLLEISRQRLRPSLREGSQIVCPRCSGLGSIRSIESLALYILRLIRHESMSGSVAEIITQVPIDVASFLLNEKRHMIDEIEHHHKVAIRVIPNAHMQTPEYHLERIYGAQTSQIGKASYSHIIEPELEDLSHKTKQQSKRIEPVVKTIDTPAKPIIKQKKTNLLSRIFINFIGTTIAKLLSSLASHETNKQKKKHHKSSQHRNKQKQYHQRKNKQGSNNRPHNKNQQRGHKSQHQNKEQIIYTNDASSYEQVNSNDKASKTQKNQRKTNRPTKKERVNQQEKPIENNAPQVVEEKPVVQELFVEVKMKGADNQDKIKQIKVPIPAAMRADAQETKNNDNKQGSKTKTHEVTTGQEQHVQSEVKKETQKTLPMHIAKPESTKPEAQHTSTRLKEEKVITVTLEPEKTVPTNLEKVAPKTADPVKVTEKQMQSQSHAKLQPIIEVEQLPTSDLISAHSQTGSKAGDKARAFHKKQLSDKKKNPYKYKMKQKQNLKTDA